MFLCLPMDPWYKHNRLHLIKLIHDMQKNRGNKGETEKYMVEASIFGSEFAETNKTVSNNI
jgi:hypothetical protein